MTIRSHGNPLPYHLALKGYSGLPLFHEACAYRRDDTSNPDSFHTQNGNHMHWVWPHTEGGNVSFHDGSVFWLRNVYDTTRPPNFYGHALGWPIGGVMPFYNYGLWGYGLDYHAEKARH
ncbi:MAG: hypothetical protein KGZ25_04435 [Planctomycetes bacterium]|nr:hypothetical protein [Planctomycetota bacterium]